MKILYIIIMMHNEFYQCNSVNKQLKHVHVLYRHGDRAPVEIFPTDRNREDKWPNGLSGLTNQGIIQHFNLGLWLRRRYNDFLGSSLNYSLIHVRSTNKDRTLMSAQSNLAGLFYNLSEEVIKGFKWHPIPVHTQSVQSDVLLEGDHCPVFLTMREKLYVTEYFRLKFQPYQSTLEFLRKKTGISNLTFLDSWMVYDTLFCEKANNITIDDWVTKEVWENMSKINNLNWELMNYGELPKIVAGFLLKTITEYLQSFIDINGFKNKGLKMVIYSGHDTDVAPLNALFGIYDNSQPPYTACLLIELYYLPLETEKWAVQVVYKGYTDSSGNTSIPVAVLPGCGSSLCPLSRFLQLMKNKILSEKQYNEICYPKYHILFIVQVIFGVAVACIILFIIIMFFTRVLRKSGSHRYSRIETDQNIN